MRVGIVLIALAFCSNATLAEDIRQFDLPTLELLGNELAHRDNIAARASDAMFEAEPTSRALKLRGWISELRKDGDKVYLITESPSGPLFAYVVTFVGNKPQVADKRGEAIPPLIALRYKAEQTARAALRGKLYDANYNFEVLSDPSKSGFLVYALATTQQKGELLTGGHYRVTVPLDASKADRIDLLGQLIRQKPDGTQNTAAIIATQLSSNLPVETWIYSSDLYRLPVFLVTKDKSYWLIANGEMHKFTEAELAASRKKEKKKK